MFVRLKNLNHLLLILSISTHLLIASTAQASQGDKPPMLEQEDLVGEARMTYLFWDVYDARLFAEGGTWDANKPFILELSYLRSLKGKAIAERSIEEMRKQGFDDEVLLDEWLEALIGIFPDVDKTSVIKGVIDEEFTTQFYFNDEFIGAIEQPAFTTQFFNIWVGEETSEPTLRKKLLGLS